MPEFWHKEIDLQEGHSLNAYGWPYPGAKQSLAFWSSAQGGSSNWTDTGERIDLDASRPGNETKVYKFQCEEADIENWTINGGGHEPAFTSEAIDLIIQWLLERKK